MIDARLVIQGLNLVDLRYPSLILLSRWIRFSPLAPQIGHSPCSPVPEDGMMIISEYEIYEGIFQWYMGLPKIGVPPVIIHW